MKILLVENAVKWSGACYNALIVAKGLIDNNHSVVIVSRTNSMVSDKFKEENIPIFECKITNDGDLKALFLLDKFIKKYKPNLVEVYNQKAYWIVAIICKLRNIPCIINNNIRISIKNKKLFKFLFNTFIDRVITASNFLMNHLNINFKYPIDKMKTIYPAINIKPYKNNDGNSTIRRELNIPNTDFLFGFIGRLSNEKGIDILLYSLSKIIKKYPFVKLIVVGDGSTNFLKKYYNFIKSENLEDYVINLGFRKDILNILNGIDCVVHPSRMDAFPISNIEVLASGTILISTYTGGIPEIIENNINGFLVESENVNELYNKMLYVIEELMKNRNNLKYIIDNGKKLVFNNYNEDRLIMEYLNFYNTFLNKIS